MIFTNHAVGAPRLRTASGLIVLYFLLQAGLGLLLGIAVGVITGFMHGRDLTQAQASISAALQQPGMPAILVILTLGIAAAITLLLAHRWWPALWTKANPPGLGFSWPARPGWFALAVIAGVAAPLAGGWLTQFLARGHALTQNIAQLGENTPMALRIALVVVVTTVGPLVEETLFRGVLFSALWQKWGSAWAVVLSSLVFALIHLPGMQFQWFGLPDLLLLALLLAGLRLRSGSIWPSMLAHAINNGLAVVAWFVAVKPPG